MRNDILHTIRYFAFFQYPPTLEELHRFHPHTISADDLLREADEMVKQHILIKKSYRRGNKVHFRYTAREYSSFFNTWRERHDNSIQKMEIMHTFVNICRYISCIQLIGLSGSVSMLNAKRSDDIDLFIITRKYRLWTGRFLSLITAQMLGIRRKRGERHANNKICLNLFFDERELQVPLEKQSEYTAHEVLQMRPVMKRGDSYMRFLDANRWVFDIFPNARKRQTTQHVPRSFRWTVPYVGDMIEYALKQFQLSIMNRHRRDERVTDRQLWFFPDDFGKKIKITS